MQKYEALTVMHTNANVLNETERNKYVWHKNPNKIVAVNWMFWIQDDYLPIMSAVGALCLFIPSVCVSFSVLPAPNWLDLRTVLPLIVWNVAHSNKHDMYPYTRSHFPWCFL